MATPTSPMPSINVSVQGPYEGAIIEGFRLLEKVIDGQSPEVKLQMWQRYLDFTQPFHEVSVALTSKVSAAISNLLGGPK